MTRARFTFDTNVLVYAFDTDAGHRHEVAKRLVAQAILADCVLTLQSLAEFFRVVTQKRNTPIDLAAAAIDNWQGAFPVVAADWGALAAAIDAVRDHRIAFWDAMLWATARRAGCRLIVTEDFQDGRELGGVWFVNPFGDALPPRLEAALQPNG